jgi:hypothetical protein
MQNLEETEAFIYGLQRTTTSKSLAYASFWILAGKFTYHSSRQERCRNVLFFNDSLRHGTFPQIMAGMLRNALVAQVLFSLLLDIISIPAAKINFTAKIRLEIAPAFTSITGEPLAATNCYLRRRGKGATCFAPRDPLRPNR